MMQITQNPSPVVYGESVTLTETTIPNKFTPTIAGATLETFSKTGSDLDASNWKGSTTQIDGILGKGALFNGITDYITADSFPTLVNKGTISMWYNPINLNSFHTLYNQGDYVSGISFWPLFLGYNEITGKMWLYLARNYDDEIRFESVDIRNLLPDNIWSYISVSFDISSGSNVAVCNMYINGSKITTTKSYTYGATFTAINGTNITLKYIGANKSNYIISTFIKGSMCNFLITADVLTDAQILQLATLPSILDERRDISIPEDYEFLETFTKTGTDAPATIIDVLYTGSGWVSTTEQRNFPIGNSAYNNGVRRYNVDSWLINRDYSICVWFKINTQWNPTYGTPVWLWGTDKGAVGTAGGLLCYVSNHSTGLVDYKTVTIITHRGDSYAFPTSTTYRVPDSIDITKWHSFVYTGDDITINNTNGKLYIDGILLSVVQANINGNYIGIGTQAKNISFGSTNVAIAMASLYYRKLTSSEALAWSNKIYDIQKSIINSNSFSYLVPIATLLRLKEAEVSMLCIDGTDGKGNAFQLHPIFSSYATKTITWTSSDELKATVSSTGVVTGVGVGDVTITCNYDGVSKSCLFTVFSTLPNENDSYGLKGGVTPVSGGNIFFNTSSRLYDLSVLANIYSHQDIINSTSAGGYVYNDGASTSSQFLISSGKLRVYLYTLSMPNRNYTVYDSVNAVSNGLKQSLKYMNSAFYINGVMSSMTVATNNSDTQLRSLFGIYFINNVDGKRVRICAASGTKDPQSLVTSIELSYIPQNYVRYSDHDGITNPTKILNIGTLGNKFDLSADNVPSLWFGV